MRILIFLLGISLFSCQDPDLQKVKTLGEQVPIDKGIASDQDIENFVQPYRDKIADDLNSVLSYTPRKMYKGETPYNSGIANMMADAVMEFAEPIYKKRTDQEIDAVLLNYGGIRSGIDQGDITLRTAYNVMPFENEIVVAELSATEMKALVAYLVKSKGKHPISGLKIQLDENGNLNTYEIQGHPLNDKQTYHVATSDYLATGGDYMNFFKKAENITVLDYKLRSLLVDYFKSKDTIDVTNDDRFTQKI
ncbi:MAG: 5'-nucleotidase C-terminal domain-containing protein [Psychroflexus sp.]|nr:5'-nucleotidase C-terminal domain-containing protein [Psychroflexus sp.]MDN6310910.1 5'-nucleotidase C-terminal domain-containing protein [Psychroflexus sp.]